MLGNLLISALGPLLRHGLTALGALLVGVGAMEPANQGAFVQIILGLVTFAFGGALSWVKSYKETKTKKLLGR